MSKIEQRLKSEFFGDKYTPRAKNEHCPQHHDFGHIET